MSNNPFQNLGSAGLEESTDRLGGYAPLESGIYEMTVKALYSGKSSGGATSVTLIADAGSQEYRETFYVTNKSGENFFLSQGTPRKKVPLPGFTVVDDLCLITTGKPLSEQTVEEKVINIYNFEAKKEEPTKVPMVMEALGQKVALGILKRLENKSKKNESTDEYEPTAETREINLVDKVFHPELHLTVAEARKGETVAKFWDAWEERNKGKTQDRREIKDGQAVAAKPGKPPVAQGGGAAPRTSLFGPKK